MTNDLRMADIFLVKKIMNEQSQTERQKWVKIGSAFPHRNGVGYSLKFDIYPDKSDIDAGHNIVILEREENEYKGRRR